MTFVYRKGFNISHKDFIEFCKAFYVVELRYENHFRSCKVVKGKRKGRNILWNYRKNLCLCVDKCAYGISHYAHLFIALQYGM